MEITVGVIGPQKQMQAMSPSLTLTGSSILTLEEKFQGGTGTNITPLPEDLIPAESAMMAQKRIELVARKLGLSGFARIDAFLHIKSGELIIIEVNTIPGLTPSTVIYHQAIAEKPPMVPYQFLERILEYRRKY